VRASGWRWPTQAHAVETRGFPSIRDRRLVGVFGGGLDAVWQRKQQSARWRRALPSLFRWRINRLTRTKLADNVARAHDSLRANDWALRKQAELLRQNVTERVASKLMTTADTPTSASDDRLRQAPCSV
jgi:hypothetical protein